MAPRLSPPRLVLGLVLVALSLIAPVAARAGTYVVSSCQDPTGAVASTSAWSTDFTSPSVDKSDNTCPRGGIHIALTPGVSHPSDANGRAFFYAPDNTSIVKYTLWRSARVAAGTAYFFDVVERYGSTWQWAGSGCKGTTNNCSGIGDPSVPLAAANRFDRVPSTPLSGVEIYVSCGNADSSGTACPASSPVAAEGWLHRADITLSDDIKPSFATAPTGELVDATAPVSGVAQVSVLGTDKGGGLTQAEVEVDGSVIASQSLGGSTCHVPFTARVPCPLSASTTIPVDTTTLPDGDHSVRILLQDAAGNVTAWGPVTLTTHNAPPDESCNPDPAVTAADAGGVQLSVGAAGPGASATASGGERLTMHYKSRKLARFNGRLVAADGSPIAGAGICVVWRPHGLDSPLQPLTRLTTDGSGRFSASVPRGSSRDLFAIYRTPAGAVTAGATVNVIPQLIVHPSRRSLRNGDVLTLRGRLRGGSIPSRGVLVRAEAWRGIFWQPFGESRARGAKGTFRIRWRFRNTAGVQRYTLRVQVLEQAAYPYLGTVSRRIHVWVRG